jgi:hypothetical protein
MEGEMTGRHAMRQKRGVALSEAMKGGKGVVLDGALATYLETLGAGTLFAFLFFPTFARRRCERQLHVLCRSRGHFPAIETLTPCPRRILTMLLLPRRKLSSFVDSPINAPRHLLRPLVRLPPHHQPLPHQTHPRDLLHPRLQSRNNRLLPSFPARPD